MALFFQEFFAVSTSLSRSDKLITDVQFAALSALSQTPREPLRRGDLMASVRRLVSLYDWAKEIYETIKQCDPYSISALSFNYFKKWVTVAADKRRGRPSANLATAELTG